MRGVQSFQGAMFSYISLEDRVSAQHPLRKLRALVDALLASMSAEFEAVYARMKRASNEAAKAGKCALRRPESDAAGGGAALVCTFSTAC